MFSARRLSPFALSLFMTMTTASAVDLNDPMHSTVAGDYNGDGRIDALFQPLDDTLPTGIFLRDRMGQLSIPGQVWDANYLGLNWGAGSSILHTADFAGTGRSDILLQSTASGGKSAVLLATPDGQFLNIGQTITNPYLGMDWSAESHLIQTGKFDGGLQQEVLLQTATAGGLNAIVHPDGRGRLTRLIETWPDGFLGIHWDATSVTLYIGDFNGDGRDDLLVQVNNPNNTEQAYFLLLADPAGKFTQIDQSWNVNAFGADWNPRTHSLSVQDLNGDGIADIVLTATTRNGQSYVMAGNNTGHFSGTAVKVKPGQTPVQALAQSAAQPQVQTKFSAVKTAATAQPALTRAQSQFSSQFAVGGMGDSGGVSGGSATYSVPISVPPGIAGMQPSLSLNYSSKGGNGEVGMGWSLSGLSAIHRCPQTMAQDGGELGVTYNVANDRLCLDGQRLIVTSGSYGHTGAVYHTEIESYAQVKQYGATDLNSSDTAFEVDYRDGKKAFYGYRSNTVNGIGPTNAMVTPAGAPAALIWAINSEMDTAGNNIVYSYTQYGNGEYHIWQVLYSGNSSPGGSYGATINSVGNRLVSFAFGPRPDPSTSWLAGGESRQTWLLSTITTYVGSKASRQYTVNYAPSQTISGGVNQPLGRSLVRSIGECAWDANNVQACLPPTNFSWLEPTLQFTQLQSVNMPGVQTGTSELTGQQQVGETQQWLTVGGDVAGDGNNELAYSYVDYISKSRVAEVIWPNSANPPLDLYALFGMDPNNSHNPPSIGLDLDNSGKVNLYGTITSGGVTTFAVALCSSNCTSAAGYTIQPIAASPAVDGSAVTFADVTGHGLKDIPALGPTVTINGVTGNKLTISQNLGPDQKTGVPQIASPATTGLLVPQQLVMPSTPPIYMQAIISDAGDLDGNGVHDLWVANVNGQQSGVIFMQPNSINPATPPTFVDIGSMGIATNFGGTHFLADINGDGLPDLVYAAPAGVGKTAVTISYQINKGGTFGPVQTAGTIPTVDGSVLNYTALLPGDFDNDGKQELMVPVARIGAYCQTYTQNRGDGIQPYIDCGDTLLTRDNAWGFDRSVYSYDIVKFVEQADGSYQAVVVTDLQGHPVTLQAEAHSTTVLDIGSPNGGPADGLTDVLTLVSPWYHDAQWATTADYANCPAQCSFSLQDGFYQSVNNAQSVNNDGVADLMRSATDAYGVTHQWQYDTLVDQRRLGKYGTGQCQPGPTSDHYCFTSSMYVVTDYQVSNDVGGMNESTYSYDSAIYNNQGRGFQGFYAMTENNLAAGTATVNTFRQDFPYAGQLLTSTVTATSSGNKISQTVNTPHCVMGDTVCISTKLVTPYYTYWPYLDSSVSTQYDPASNGAVVSTSTKTFSGYDLNYGHVGQTSVTTLDGSATPTGNPGTYTANISVSYQPDATHWCLDEMSSQQTTSSVSYVGNTNASLNLSDTKTRTTNYDYFQDGTCHLKDQYADPGTAFEKDSAYIYDSFGNTHTVTVSTPVALPPANHYGTLVNTQDYGAPSRASTTNYTADGYFVSTTVNPLGHTTTVNTVDSASGQPTKVTDPNGVVSTFAYDAFGRKVQETDGPLPTVYTSYTTPYAAITLGPTPSNSVYAVNVTQAGYPSHTTYYDLLGKPLRGATDGAAAGNPSIVDTDYDFLGRVTQTSEPFLQSAGAASAWNYVNNYDILSRPTKKTDSEGVITSYVYSGLQTTVTTQPTDSPTRVDAEVHNALGKMLSVENGQGGGATVDGITQFRYDAQGNPVIILDAKGNQTLATYNLVGQKIQLQDPDMGTWTYAYDVLGQLLEQKDAKGQVTDQNYDLLGRMTSRVQPETQPSVTAIWCYDGYSLNTTSPTAGCTGSQGGGAIGKPSAVGQSDGYSETYTYDTSSRPINVHTTISGAPYDTSTAYDGSGRVASVTYPASYADTAPVVSATGTTTVALSSSGSVTVSLTGSATFSSSVFSPTYAWSQTCGANGCGTLATPSAMNTTFTATAPGVYSFTLTANDGFLPNTSSTVTVTVTPAAISGTPGAVTENNTTTSYIGQATLSWNSTAGANGYKILASINNGPYNPIGPMASGSPMTLTGLGSTSGNPTYTFEVQGCDSVTGLCGPASAATVSVLVGLTPGTPRTFTLPTTSNPDGSISLSWTPSLTGYSASYTVYLGHMVGGTMEWADAECTANYPATSCTIAAGPWITVNSYYAEIQAQNLKVSGWEQAANSNNNQVTLSITKPPAPSVGIAPNPSTNGLYTVSWTPQSWAPAPTSYVVYHSPDNVNWTSVSVGNVLSSQDGHWNNGTWYYEVAACGSGGCGVPSASVSVTVNMAPPPAPTLSAQPTSLTVGNDTTLSWQENNAGLEASSYNLQSATTSIFSSPTTIYSGGNLSYADGPVKTSYYRVQACGAGGCSGWSNSVTVTVTACKVNCFAPVQAPTGQPTANNGSVTTSPGRTVSGSLNASGSGTLTFFIVTPPANGSLALTNAATGAFTYTPVNGYTGNDSFTFRVRSSNGISNLATETISINPVVASTESLPLMPAQALAASAGPESGSGPVVTGAPVPAPISRSRHSGASRSPVHGVQPLYAPPAYQYYADAQVVQASGSQTLARLTVAYGYTSTGYLNALTNAQSPTGKGVFWTLGSTGLDAHGNVLSESFGNGVTTTNTYNDPKGRITGISTLSGSTTVQNSTYSWYSLGNLQKRTWVAGTATPSESFNYDVLNRLTSANLMGTTQTQNPVSYVYDVLGNITTKSDVGTYTYSGVGAGPHAVTSVAGTVNGVTNPTFTYDTNGNITNRGGTGVQWNSLNLPTCMDGAGGTCASGSSYSKFAYAPTKERYQQTAMVSGTGETTTYVGGVEFLTTGGATSARHRLSAYGQEIMTFTVGDTANCGTSGVCFNYVHSDHLGGVDAVSNGSGAVPTGSSFGYDTFGLRRDPASGNKVQPWTQVSTNRKLTHRGFTKHEMLDNVGIIHMNGRVYDPNLGRFLSVDPVFQFPNNGQTLNPYSYVMNNPLSLTDPSGYATDGQPCPTGQNCGTNNSSVGENGAVQAGKLYTIKDSNGNSHLVYVAKDGEQVQVTNTQTGQSTVVTAGGAGSNTVTTTNGATTLQSSIGSQTKPTSTNDIGGPGQSSKQPANTVPPARLMEGSDDVLQPGTILHPHPVFAQEAGRVIREGWQKPEHSGSDAGLGYRVSIDEGPGYRQYGHMDPDSITIRVGDPVRKGEVIGDYASPTNGNSTGPHVHEEYRLWSNPSHTVNPGTVSPLGQSGRVTTPYGAVDGSHGTPHQGIDWAYPPPE